MSCSAVTLSVATVLSVIAVACLAIGFSTDNWYEIRVDTNRTRQYLDAINNDGGGGSTDTNGLFKSIWPCISSLSPVLYLDFFFRPGSFVDADDDAYFNGIDVSDEYLDDLDDDDNNGL